MNLREFAIAAMSTWAFSDAEINKLFLDFKMSSGKELKSLLDIISHYRPKLYTEISCKLKSGQK